MGNTWNMTDCDSKRGKDGTTVTVLPLRSDSAKSVVEAAYKQSLQKRKTGCRELVESHAWLPKATPSIHLHCSTCTCSPPSPLDTSTEDEALFRRIQAASALCRARALSSPGSSPKLASFAAIQSVGRWLTGSTPPSTADISELCFAVSALDVSKTVRLLFDANTPINARNAAGVPPLISCIRSHLSSTHPLSHTAMLTLLLDAGADPNIVTSPSPASGSMSALSAASALGHVPIVRTLLSRGADVDAKLSTIPMSRFTGHGLTALHVAVFADKPAVADLLLSPPQQSGGGGGADVSAIFDGYRAVVGSGSGSGPASNAGGQAPQQRRQRRQHGRVWTTDVTPLHLAAEVSAACTAVLLRRGADADARDGSGRRAALHWAAGGGNADAARLLLEAGTPADVLDDDGATPLAVLAGRLEGGASRVGYPEVAGMLLAAGASPDLRYPRELSVRQRLLLMEEWRGVYAPIFERYRC